MKSDSIERILNIDLVLRRILGFLEPSDLRAAVLVSRTWESLLARREVWGWARVNISEENVLSVVQSDRINLVGEINIQRSAASSRTLETLFRFLATCSHLKVRKLSLTGGLDLSFLPPDILSQSLLRDRVNLRKMFFFNPENPQKFSH